MSKNTKKVKMEDDCGGLKPYNPIKPPKKTTAKKKVVKKGNKK